MAGDKGRCDLLDRYNDSVSDRNSGNLGTLDRMEKRENDVR